MNRKSRNFDIKLTPGKKVGRSPTEDIEKSLVNPQLDEAGPSTPKRRMSGLFKYGFKVVDSPQPVAAATAPKKPAYHPIVELRPCGTNNKRKSVWGCPYKMDDGNFCTQINATTVKPNLLGHYWVVHLNQPFNCTVDNCGKSFMRSDSLKKHVAAEHPGGGFRCFMDDCEGEKGYVNKAAVHAGERHYCPEGDCKKSYSGKPTLLRHVKTRHNYDLIPCRKSWLNEDGSETPCEALFNDYSERSRHEKYMHDKVGYCSVCSYQPTRNELVTSHYLTKAHKTKELLQKYYELGEGALGPNSKLLVEKAREDKDTQDFDPSSIRLISAPKVTGIVKAKNAERGTIACGSIGCRCSLKSHFSPNEKFIIKDTFAVEVQGLFDCLATNIVYMITCDIHDAMWYLGLTIGEAKARWIKELSDIITFRKLRIEFFGKDHDMTEKDRASFYEELRNLNLLGRYTYMIAHFAEHGCFWHHIRFHGVLKLSNVADLNLSEAFYQFFTDATNYDIGGHNMI